MARGAGEGMGSKTGGGKGSGRGGQRHRERSTVRREAGHAMSESPSSPVFVLCCAACRPFKLHRATEPLSLLPLRLLLLPVLLMSGTALS